MHLTSESFNIDGETCWIDIVRGNISKFGMGVEYKVKVSCGEKAHKLSFRVPCDSPSKEIPRVWSKLVDRVYFDGLDIPKNLLEVAKKYFENKIDEINNLQIQ